MNEELRQARIEAMKALCEALNRFAQRMDELALRTQQVQKALHELKQEMTRAEYTATCTPPPEPEPQCMCHLKGESTAQVVCPVHDGCGMGYW